MIALVLVCATSALADEVDLSQHESGGRVPAIVVRAEGGSDFAPYGMVGGVVSWMAYVPVVGPIAAPSAQTNSNVDDRAT